MYKLILTILILINISFAKDIEIPGKFNYYEFSLTWLPGFCEYMSYSTNECKIATNKNFSSKNFVLHGLWPNVLGDTSHSYEDCRDNYTECSSDMSTTECWCSQKSLGLSAEYLLNLQIYMPGVLSCLQKHEWYTHGNCTLYTPKKYFNLSVNLVKEFSNSSFNKFINDKKGTYVTNRDLKREFDKSFGKNSSVSLKLFCGQGDYYLKEIQFAIKKDFFKDNNLSDSIIKVETVDFSGFSGCDSNKIKIESFVKN